MSYTRWSVFEKPKWFIRFKGKKIETNEEVVSELKCLNKQLVVVTAIGSSRLGKSWILNRLANTKEKNGFAVADGQSAVTQGIWILCRAHQRKENCITVFLDTEGFHDAFKDDSSNEDNRLFIIAFLLCNVLIYNVSIKFDNNDLEKVGFITRITEKLQRSNPIYPEFVLLVRDVAELRLGGKDVSPDEYLDRILTSGKEHSSKLLPKACITEHCKRRYCFKMTHPTEKAADLRKLHQDDVPLTEEYLKDEGDLKQYLVERADVKRVSASVPCTAKVFCGTIPDIVKKVEEGGIPVVTSILQSVAKKENEVLLRGVQQRFQKSLCDESSNKAYSSFKTKAEDLKTTGFKELTDNIVSINAEEKQQCLDVFKDFADGLVQRVSKQNCQVKQDACFNPIFEKVREKKYEPPNARDQFKTDISKARGECDEYCVYFGHENAEVGSNIEEKIRTNQDLLSECDSRYQLERDKEVLLLRERQSTRGADGWDGSIAGPIAVGLIRLAAIAASHLSQRPSSDLDNGWHVGFDGGNIRVSYHYQN